MNENRISVELKAADVAAINEAVGVLTAKLQPYLIALETEEKRNMAKMGEKSVSFVEKATQYAVTNPEFLPGFVDAAEMSVDFKAFNALNNILRPLMQITKNLDDTATLCGSEAILAALAYYNSVKQGVKMNVPNAKAIYDDLSARFEAQKGRRAKPDAAK